MHTGRHSNQYVRIFPCFFFIAETLAHAQRASRHRSGTGNGRKEFVDGKVTLLMFYHGDLMI